MWHIGLVDRFALLVEFVKNIYYVDEYIYLFYAKFV